MIKLFLIIIVQLIYVPMLNLRTISMVKDLKIFAAFFGFLESFIYVFALSIVLSGERNTLEMFIYALGFSIGLIVGIYIEKKLAIGFIIVNVNIAKKNDDMISYLRNQGFGVTVCSAEGRNGTREKIEILTKRSREKELLKYIFYYEPTAFIIAYEPKTFKGGYLTKLIKNGIKKPSYFKNITEKAPIKLSIWKRFCTLFKKEFKELKKPLDDNYGV